MDPRVRRASERFRQEVEKYDSPDFLAFAEAHQEALDKVNGRLMFILGMCLSELGEAGLSADDIGVYCSLAAKAALG